MSTRMQTQVKAAPKPSFTPVQGGLLQRKCACGGAPGLTGECEECRKKRLTLQRRPDDQAEPSTVPPIVQEVLRSSGQPLDADTRAFMEPRFGHDFSQVRVHTDDKAAASAQAVNALAYTVGRNVVFGANKYAPKIPHGRGLLAHELAHTIQQSGANSAAPSMAPHGIFESSADAAGHAIANGQAVSGDFPACGVGLARAPVNPEDLSDESLAREIQRVSEKLKQASYPGRDGDLAWLQRLKAAADRHTETRSRAEAVTEAEAVIARMDEALKDDDDEDYVVPMDLSLAARPYARRKKGPPAPPSKFSPGGFTNEDIYKEHIKAKSRMAKDESDPAEEPEYWERRSPDLLRLRIEIANKTEYVEQSTTQTIEHLGDRGDEKVDVDISYWKMSRPALRAYLVHMVGSLTAFEEKLVQGEWNLGNQLTPIVPGSKILGYYVQSGGSGNTVHTVYDRDGNEIEQFSSEAPLVNMGIGPLALVIPGARAVNLGRSVVDKLARPLGSASRSMLIKTKLALGSAEAGAAGAAQTALGQIASRTSVTLVENRAASAVAQQAIGQTTVRAGVQSAVQPTAQIGVQTAVQSAARTGVQTTVQTVSPSLTGLAGTAGGIVSIQGAEAPLVQASEVDRAFAESLETTGETYQGTQRLARGNLGERLATDALVADGHTIIFFKPDIQGTNQGGIDIVTLRDGQVFFVDNKALTRSGNVSSVSALTTNLGQNVQAVRADLRTSLARSDLSQAERQVFQEALSAIDAGRVRCAVTNANLTRDDRVLSGVTEGLEGQGIEFIDVFRSLVYGPWRR